MVLPPAPFKKWRTCPRCLPASKKSPQNPSISLALRPETIRHPDKRSKLGNDATCGLGMRCLKHLFYISSQAALIWSVRIRLKAMNSDKPPTSTKPTSWEDASVKRGEGRASQTGQPLGPWPGRCDDRKAERTAACCLQCSSVIFRINDCSGNLGRAEVSDRP